MSSTTCGQGITDYDGFGLFTTCSIGILLEGLKASSIPCPLTVFLSLQRLSQWLNILLDINSSMHRQFLRTTAINFYSIYIASNLTFLHGL